MRLWSDSNANFGPNRIARFKVHFSLPLEYSIPWQALCIFLYLDRLIQLLVSPGSIPMIKVFAIDDETVCRETITVFL